MYSGSCPTWPCLPLAFSSEFVTSLVMLGWVDWLPSLVPQARGISVVSLCSNVLGKFPPAALDLTEAGGTVVLAPCDVDGFSEDSLGPSGKRAAILSCPTEPLRYFVTVQSHWVGTQSKWEREH